MPFLKMSDGSSQLFSDREKSTKQFGFFEILKDVRARTYADCIEEGEDLLPNCTVLLDGKRFLLKKLGVACSNQKHLQLE